MRQANILGVSTQRDNLVVHFDLDCSVCQRSSNLVTPRILGTILKDKATSAARE